MSSQRVEAAGSARSAGFIAVSTVMLAVTTAIASTTLWLTYRDVALVVVIAVTFAAAALIAILGAVFRWPSPIVLLAVLGTYFVLGVPLAVPSLAFGGVLPTLEGLKELVLASALSWKQLVTISAPVGVYGSLLVPVFILILVTVVVSLTVALRTPMGELAVLGPIVVFVVGILFGADAALAPFPIAFGLTTSILLWLMWSRWYRRRASILLIPERNVTAGDQPVGTVADGGFVGARALLSAAIILAIAGTSSFAAMRILPPVTERVVLRTTVVQPFDARDYSSPLSGFRKYEQAENKASTMFTVSGLPEGTRIRIATLDSYNGVVYAVGQGAEVGASGAFTRVPMSVDQSAVKGTTATVRVTIGDYSGVWVPTIGKLVRIEFEGDDASKLLEGFYYNRDIDTAAAVGGVARGDAYTITAILPTQPSEAARAELQPGSVELPPMGVVPDELVTTLESYVAGVTAPGERLVAMLEGLRREGYVSHGVGADEPASRSGHAADRITELLTAQRMVGDQEQYAVTAALMARQLGFPARVVFGFAPESSGSAAEVRVTGSDVSAWIEVDTVQYGWVAIDPTPPIRPIPDAEPEVPAEVARPQSPVQPQVPAADAFDSQLPPNTSQEDPPAENPVLVIILRMLTTLGWIVLGGLILLSPFLAVIITKWRRRRLRRRASTPLRRIEGGWDEFADAVLDHGYSPGPAPTRLEVAQSVGGTQPFVLAAVADRAVFGPGEPDAEQAVQLWAAIDDLRYSLDYELTTWQRIKVLISLRSLGGYSFTKLFRREGAK